MIPRSAMMPKDIHDGEQAFGLAHGRD